MVVSTKKQSDHAVHDCCCACFRNRDGVAYVRKGEIRITLSLDYVQKPRHELVITREIPIVQQEVDTFTYRMLHNNRLPEGFMNVHLLEQDGMVSFRVPFAPYKLLIHSLAKQSLTMNHWLLLLHDFAVTVESGRTYMLDEYCYYIDDATVFFHEQMNRIALCYVPLRKPAQSSPLQSRLLLHALKWLTYVRTELDLSKVHEIIHALSDEHFEWHLFRDRCAILSASSTAPTLYEEVDESSEFLHRQWDDKEQESPTPAYKDRWLLGGIVVSGPLVSLIGFGPTMVTVYVALAFGIGSAVYYYWRSQRTQLIQRDDLDETNLSVSLPVEPHLTLNETTQLLPLQAEWIEESEPIRTLRMRREFRGQATVFDVAQKCLLGRDAAVCPLVDDFVNVSRIHVELSLTSSGQQLFAKDLASSNGTTLNDQPMVPYKKYPLQEGDRLQLGGEQGPTYICIAY